MECLLHARHCVRHWRDNDGEGAPLALQCICRSRSHCMFQLVELCTAFLVWAERKWAQQITWCRERGGLASQSLLDSYCLLGLVPDAIKPTVS